MRYDRNIQLEIFGLLINLFLIVYLQLNSSDTIFILIACFLVIVAEVFNSSIEKMADLINPNFDPKIGIIKDIAAGGVVLMFILSIIIALIIYPKYLF